jgi:hypothetical protein
MIIFKFISLIFKSIKDTFIYKETVSAHTVLSKYCEDMYPKSISKCYSINTPLNVELPYPDIFSKITTSTEHFRN